MEIVVAIAILAIAMSLGLPAMSTWIQNAQIRTGAEGVMAGLQKARAEAVQRNTPVEFELTAPGTVGGTGWVIRLRNTDLELQAQPAGEGSRNAQLTTTPDSALLTFNGLGRILPLNDDGSAPFTQIDIDNPNMAAAESRELRITLNQGGAVRMCDPNLTVDSDPRSC